MNLKQALLFAAMMIALPLAYNACGQAQFSTTTESILPSGTRVGNPFTPSFVKTFTASPTFSSRICLVEIILEDSMLVPFSFPVSPTIIDLDPNGFPLPPQNFPNGDYFKFSLLVAPSCSSMTASQEVTNANGSFSTNTSYTLSFSGGAHTITGDGSQWDLGIQPLINELEQVTNSADIETRMRLTQGTF